MVCTGREREKIEQNLASAGCYEDDIKKIMDAIDNDRLKEMLALVESHRSKLLDQYHRSKERLDCIDFFLYEFKKNLGVKR